MELGEWNPGWAQGSWVAVTGILVHSAQSVRLGLSSYPPLFLLGQVEGRLGPSTVVLDHTSGFEGLLLVDDDLLGVSEGRVWVPRSEHLLHQLKFLLVGSVLVCPFLDGTVAPDTPSESPAQNFLA